MPSAGEVEAMRAALLEFFDASARDLPWRRTADPYAVWISEVMAQQTRIDTVVPYYERWLRRFPDVVTLADAPLDDVLKHWEGLGYYGRARNLHAAARVLRERHAGRLPADYDALRALPGVGEYTAGAIASIAFGAPHPAVDGNARRVLARLLDDPAPSPARLRDVAGRLAAHDRAGDVNQAIMELGATVCTPRAPRCDACPLRPNCRAARAGTQLQRPARKPAARLPLHVMATALIVAADGRTLLVRRPPSGLLAGLWSFPAREVAAAADAAAAARAECEARLGGVDVARVGSAGDVEHTFSHRRERYACWRIDLASSPPAPADAAWVGADLSAHALPRAQQRIHRLLFT